MLSTLLYALSPRSGILSRLLVTNILGAVATDAAQLNYLSFNSSVSTKLSILTFIIVRKQQLLFYNVDLRLFFIISLERFDNVFIFLLRSVVNL